MGTKAIGVIITKSDDDPNGAKSHDQGNMASESMVRL
jgi:hypothetical protein